MVFAAVDPDSNFVMSHHCKDNCQEQLHHLRRGTDTVARRMANLKWPHLDQFLSELLFEVVAHRLPFLTNLVSLGRCPEHLAEIGTALLDILADRSRLLVVMCRMDTGNQEQVLSDVFALVLAFVSGKRDNL